MNRPQLLRRFEAVIRTRRGIIDMRWLLKQAGMSEDEIHTFRKAVEDRIREEREQWTKKNAGT